MRYVSVEYKAHVPQDKIPESIDLADVLDQYSKHGYHLGSWPKSEPEPTQLPKVSESSHIVRTVQLNDDGGLDVSFVFMSSPRGFALMREFDKSDFEMAPIISEDGSMIVRFDFLKEE